MTLRKSIMHIVAIFVSIAVLVTGVGFIFTRATAENESGASVQATSGAVDTSQTTEGESAAQGASTLDKDALETYYAGIYTGSCKWIGANDTSPDDKLLCAYDNFTLSYKFKKAGSVGFRFTTASGKTVSVLRQNLVLTMNPHGDGGKGTKVKISVNDYYKSIYTSQKPNFTKENRVNSTAVGTDDYIAINGETSILGNSVHVINHDTDNVHTVALRKVTEGDKATYRFYVDNENLCVFDFEESIVGVGITNLSAVGFADVNVKLNTVITQAQKDYDAASSKRAATLTEAGQTYSLGFKKFTKTNTNDFGGDFYHIAFDLNDGRSIVFMPDFQVISGRKENLLRLYLLEGDSFASTAMAANTLFAKLSVKDMKCDYGFSDNDYNSYRSVQPSNTGIGNGTAILKYINFYNDIKYWAEADGVYNWTIKRVADETISDVECVAVEIGLNGHSVLTLAIAKTALTGNNLPVRAFTGSLGCGHFTGFDIKDSDGNYVFGYDTYDMDNAAAVVTFDDKYAEVGQSSVRFSMATKGLRFSAELQKSMIDYAKTLAKEQTEVEFGVKLVRSDGAAAHIKAVNKTDKGEYYTFNGCVYNIQDVEKTYTPYIYVKYTDKNDQTQYYYTAAGEAKSMKEVALSAIAAAKAGVVDEATETKKNHVTVDGKTGYSEYTQSMIDTMVYLTENHPAQDA